MKQLQNFRVLPNPPDTTPDTPQCSQALHEVCPRALAYAEDGQADGD